MQNFVVRVLLECKKKSGTGGVSEEQFRTVEYFLFHNIFKESLAQAVGQKNDILKH